MPLPEPNICRPQLLLIDDDRKLTRLLIEFLDLQGFDTTVAYTGEEGLALAKAHPWNLVILDVMLPGMDGHEILRRLRELSQVPVLMLTGRGGEDDLIAGLEGGADDYLSKATSSRELATRVRALLRRATAPADRDVGPDTSMPAKLCIGALSIQAATRSVEVEDVPVFLTSVEFDLLSILIRKKGQVLTREQLLKEVRNRDFTVFDRAIDVHVASLRRKLGDDPREPRFIRTIRSVGYTFVDPEQI
jgi:DNA-binding response OmpR family regulator